MKKIIISIIVVLIVISSGLYMYSQPEIRWEVGKTFQLKEGTSPQTIDPNLKISEVVTGAHNLTTFAFIDNNIL